MSEKFVRKEARYGLKEFGLKGEIILFPDPRVIEIGFDDISSAGAGITILSAVDEGQKKELATLVKASKEGNKIPVQLIFNNTKIPVHLTNMISEKCYGIAVSDNQKLAALAEKGKQFFQAIVQAASKKGATESAYTDYPILSREFLEEDIRNFVEAKIFMVMFVPIMVNEIIARFQALKGKVEGRNDQLQVEKLFFQYINQTGRDLQLLVGATIYSLRRQNTAKRMPLESYMPLAVRQLLDSDKMFNRDERASFERFLVDEYLRKRTPTQYKELPPKHPLADAIKLKFDTFSRSIFFMQKLGPYVCDYYYNRFLSPSSELMKLVGTGDRLVKTTLFRWIQNELNEFASAKGNNSGNLVDEAFKQAMYEYVLRKKATNISQEETADLFEGKIAEPLQDIRLRFLADVCKLLEQSVNKRFAEYKANTDQERAKQQSEKEDHDRIHKMEPHELMVRFCWPKILEMGETTTFQREVARTWIPKEKYLSFAELGHVAIIPHPAYEEFVAAAKGIITSGDRPQDLFDVIDVQKLYKAIVESPGGRVRKDIFGLYMDALQPPFARELVMEKVINSPVWSRYYVINKSKQHLGKITGVKGMPLLRIVEKSMLTGKFELSEYV